MRAPQLRLASALSGAPSRLLIMFVTLAALDIACQTIGAVAAARVPVAARPATELAAAVFLSGSMLGVYRWLVHTLEKRSADELSLAGAAPRIGIGILLGSLLFVAVYAILWILGAATFLGAADLSGVAAALATAIASAFGEEIVFRGVVFRLVEDRLGTTRAVMLSAGAFALIHAANPGATWFSTAAIALEAGVLLALAYVATRSLWMPIGLHFGWNFTEGGVFGEAVSGGRYSGLVSAHLSGPAVITGGAFGPEASVIAVAVALCASAFLAWYAVRHGAWRGMASRIGRGLPNCDDPSAPGDDSRYLRCHVDRC